MDREFKIQYSDGTEIGPLDQDTIEAMRNSGEIPSDATIAEIETHDVCQAFYNFIRPLFDSGNAYSEMAPEEINEIERYYLHLLRLGAKRWNTIDVTNYHIINSLPGRRDLLGDPLALAQSATLLDVVSKLDRISEHIQQLTSALTILTRSHPTQYTYPLLPSPNPRAAVQTAAAIYGVTELREINDNLSDISDSLS